MKKFRQIWLVFVVVVVLLFGVYHGMQMIKADSSGPVISGGGDLLEISIHDDDTVVLNGLTATDKKDGDVTASLMVESVSNFYEDTRTATVVAFDSDHHISKVNREISYTDYTPPKFELTGSLRFRAGEQVNIDKIVKATDCLDGDLSNKVKIYMETSINNRMTGFYEVEYEVSNSAGDVATLPIEVEIYEPYNNEVQLNLSKYLVYYDGKNIDYKSFLKSVTKGSLEYPFEGVNLIAPPVVEEENDQEEDEAVESVPTVIPKSRVRIDEQVNENVPGIYPVYFYYTENHETYTSTAKEVVYVVVQ